MDSRSISRTTRSACLCSDYFVGKPVVRDYEDAIHVMSRGQTHTAVVGDSFPPQTLPGILPTAPPW